MQVKVNLDLCVGAGLCVMTIDEVFSQGEDNGLVILMRKKPSPDQFERVRDAVRACPSHAISIESEDLG